MSVKTTVANGEVTRRR